MNIRELPWALQQNKFFILTGGRVALPFLLNTGVFGQQSDKIFICALVAFIFCRRLRSCFLQLLFYFGFQVSTCIKREILWI
jgi:hypothetical protein